MTKIVFFGTGPVAAASLRFLVDRFEIEAVITKPRAKSHKGSVPVEELAQEKGLPLHFSNNKADLDDLFNNHSFVSPSGIVVDFGIIISQQVIDSFPKGIINSHFSLLPQWRGADPISYTILSGQPKTGVSLMVIDVGLDTGKLIMQRTIAVDSKETTGTLTDKLVDLSNTLLAEYVPHYLADEITPKNQPHPDRATHSHKLSKSESIINWDEPAEVIERKIRAFLPWPKARTKIGQIECIILDADILADDSGKKPGTLTVSAHQLIVSSGAGSLSINSLQPLGKKEMPVTAFLAGYRSQLDT